MALVEVYVSQRSLAFELNTAVLRKKLMLNMCPRCHGKFER